MGYDFKKIPSRIPGELIYETTVAVTDDTDVTLVANFGTKRFKGARIVEQSFNNDYYVNYYTLNATGTSVVATCSTSTTSAAGTVKWEIFFDDI